MREREKGKQGKKKKKRGKEGKRKENEKGRIEGRTERKK